MQKLILGALLLALGACVQTQPSPQVPQQPGLVSDASPTIYFVISGDTDNRYNCLDFSVEECRKQIISMGFASNVSAIASLANEIPRLPTAPGGVPFRVAQPVMVTGERFTCANIEQAIDGLPVRPGIDIVWFHHSGHGLNAGSGPDPDFQRLQCGPFVTLSDLRLRILAKRPRLALIFADSCNIQGGQAFPAAAAAAPPAVQNYLPLLTNYKGWLMGGAAKPGEFAWYTINGGTYTTSLLGLMRKSRDWNQVISWDQVISRLTAAPLVTPGADATQTPIFNSSSLQRL